MDLVLRKLDRVTLYTLNYFQNHVATKSRNGISDIRNNDVRCERLRNEFDNVVDYNFPTIRDTVDYLITICCTTLNATGNGTVTKTAWSLRGVFDHFLRFFYADPTMLLDNGALTSGLRVMRESWLDFIMSTVQLPSAIEIPVFIASGP